MTASSAADAAPGAGSPLDRGLAALGLAPRDVLFVLLVIVCYGTPLWVLFAQGWWHAVRLWVVDWRVAAAGLFITGLLIWLLLRGSRGRFAPGLVALAVFAAPLLLYAAIAGRLPFTWPAWVGPGPGWPWAVAGLWLVIALRNWRWAVPLFTVVFFAVTAGLGVFNYLTAGVVHDLQFFDQALWKTLHGEFLVTTLEPPTTLAAHFAPIQLAWLAVYAVAPSGATLVVLQAAAVALALFPLHRILARRGLPRWVTLTLLVGWAMHPSVLGPLLAKFHEYPFIAVFLLWAWDCLERRRFWGFALNLLGVLLIKEHAGLVVVMMGLLSVPAVLRRRLPARWVLAPVALGIAGLLTAQAIVRANLPPGADAPGFWTKNYAYLGETPRDGLRTMVTQPDLVWDRLSKPRNRLYLTALTRPFGYWLPWFSGAWAPAVPDLAAITLSDTMNYPFRLLRWHYHIVIATVLTIAFVNVLVACRRRWNLAPGAVALPVVLFFLYNATTLPQHRTDLRGLALTAEERAARLRIVDRVPADASVAASGHTVLFFIRRNPVVRLGVQRSLDFTPDCFVRQVAPLADADPPTGDMLIAAGYGLVAIEGPFELWVREGVDAAP